MADDDSASKPPSQPIFQTSVVADGYSYWRSKTIDGRLPNRADINPVEIPRLMQNVVLLDVQREPEFDFRYRLVGTNVTEHHFRDYTGSWFSEIDHKKAPSEIWHNCKNVAETGEAYFDGTPYVGPHQGYRDTEDIILPLSEDGHTVDTLLVFVCFTSKSDE